MEKSSPLCGLKIGPSCCFHSIVRTPGLPLLQQQWSVRAPGCCCNCSAMGLLPDCRLHRHHFSTPTNVSTQGYCSSCPPLVIPRPNPSLASPRSLFLSGQFHNSLYYGHLSGRKRHERFPQWVIQKLLDGNDFPSQLICV